MDVEEHIVAVEREGALFAEAARSSGLDSDVRYCPGWDVRDLVRHLGMIHLWAAGHVAFPHDEGWYETEADEHAAFAEFWPELGIFWPDDAVLIDWYLRTNANLVDALISAAPDLEAWTFLPAPSARAMWARRQAHEIAIHRFDAEHAGHGETGFEPTFADDGIDEILAGFAPRMRSFSVEGESTMAVHATDTDTRWRLTMSSEGIRTVTGAEPADMTLSGAASDLYLALWNRGDDTAISIEGDRSVMDTWRERLRIQWT